MNRCQLYTFLRRNRLHIINLSTLGVSCSTCQLHLHYLSEASQSSLKNYFSGLHVVFQGSIKYSSQLEASSCVRKPRWIWLSTLGRSSKSRPFTWLFFSNVNVTKVLDDGNVRGTIPLWCRYSASASNSQPVKWVDASFNDAVREENQQLKVTPTLDRGIITDYGQEFGTKHGITGNYLLSCLRAR
jgi:hypothetical protein